MVRRNLRWSYSIIIMIVVVCCTMFDAHSEQLFGVNLSGAEWGNRYPGTFGTDYTYPTASELDYYKSKGLTLIRLPFLWERVQSTLYGNLNSVEIGRIQSVVSAAASRGMYVVLDAHNYGRYGLGTFGDVTSHGNVIGSSAVPASAFADFWTKMASTFKGNAGVFGYDLSNEPHDMNGLWAEDAQAAINGIRSVDAESNIIIEGDGWSGAQYWASNNPSFPLNDPYNHVVYEAHLYFDSNSSGNYSQSYDAQGAYPTIGVDRVMPFIQWLASHRVGGYVGEYGVPHSDARWLTVLDNFLNTLNTNNVFGTYWAGGPWWNWCSDSLAVEPCGGKDAPQMATLAKYPSGGTTPPGGTVVRIDAGSAVSYTDSKGQVWSADTDSVGGATVNRGAITIANTTDPRIYQTEHYGMSSYRVPVANGTYNVNLEFAETYLSAAGQRVFDVAVGGQTLANLDVFAQAGGKNTALVKSFTNIPVSNGVLVITFTPHKQSPEINGIEILGQ
jgi:endoglucanase